MSTMLATSTTLPTSRTAVDVRLALSLAAVYLIWSSTYLVMKLAVVELPPMLMSSIRFVAAGLVMLLIAMRRGVPFPGARAWLRVLPIGALLFLGGNGLVSIAQLSVSSGGAAVVCAMMPLWVGVLGAISGEKPTKREWVSLVIGFVGIIVLMGGPSLAGEPMHIAMIIGAPFSWALGSVMARRLPSSIGGDTFMLPAMEMLTGGAALAIVGFSTGERVPIDASPSAWLAVAYLFVFGSLLGFTAYNWLLRHARPTVATSYAYVNPVLAVLLGAVISGEQIGPTTLIANGLIVVAVMLALRRTRPGLAR
jgi:drug/metabolite transporter (DMT)-like permease